MAKPRPITNTNPRLSLVPSSAVTRPGSEDDELAGAAPAPTGLDGLDAIETRELERQRFDRGEFEPGELEAGESGAALEGPEGEAVEKPPLSPAAKLGIGAGAVAGAGLLGYGVYALGKRAGWWGSSGIVIDDSPAPSPKDDDARPNDGGGGGGGGENTSGKRARGNPPNVTGDNYGYNSTLFPAPLPVRVAMKAIGYPVEIGTVSLYQNNQPDERVSSFQREWNRVIKAIDAGSINLPNVTSSDDARWVDALRGLLEVDGIPGKRTLCALEIAFSNQVKNGLGWRGLVEKA